METEIITIQQFDADGNLVAQTTMERTPPDRVVRRALTEIDAITNLADAKAFLRRLVIVLARTLDGQ